MRNAAIIKGTPTPTPTPTPIATASLFDEASAVVGATRAALEEDEVMLLVVLAMCEVVLGGEVMIDEVVCDAVDIDVRELELGDAAAEVSLADVVDAVIMADTVEDSAASKDDNIERKTPVGGGCILEGLPGSRVIVLAGRVMTKSGKAVGDAIKLGTIDSREVLAEVVVEVLKRLGSSDTGMLMP